MKLVKDFPPNYKAIIKTFPEVKNEPRAIFTYGDTIYAPSGEQGVTPDLVIHESVHEWQQEQQKTIFRSGPENWWRKWLKDPKFRAEQELEAYREQYKFLKVHIKSREQLNKQLLRLADDLSCSIYGGIMTKSEAFDLIKKDL